MVFHCHVRFSVRKMFRGFHVHTHNFPAEIHPETQEFGHICMSICRLLLFLIGFTSDGFEPTRWGGFLPSEDEGTPASTSSMGCTNSPLFPCSRAWENQEILPVRVTFPQCRCFIHDFSPHSRKDYPTKQTQDICSTQS